jgi:hypothetical protein
MDRDLFYYWLRNRARADPAINAEAASACNYLFSHQAQASRAACSGAGMNPASMGDDQRPAVRLHDRLVIGGRAAAENLPSVFRRTLGGSSLAHQKPATGRRSRASRLRHGRISIVALVCTKYLCAASVTTAAMTGSNPAIQSKLCPAAFPDRLCQYRS